MGFWGFGDFQFSATRKNKDNFTVDTQVRCSDSYCRNSEDAEYASGLVVRCAGRNGTEELCQVVYHPSCMSPSTDALIVDNRLGNLITWWVDSDMRPVQTLSCLPRKAELTNKQISIRFYCQRHREYPEDDRGRTPPLDDVVAALLPIKVKNPAQPQQPPKKKMKPSETEKKAEKAEKARKRKEEKKLCMVEEQAAASDDDEETEEEEENQSDRDAIAAESSDGSF